MPIISFDNVSYKYPEADAAGAYALNGINLSIEEGEFIAVMGKTGSGKTTLSKLINGIIPHNTGGSLTGTVTIDGLRAEKSPVPKLAQIAGLVLDDPDSQLFSSSVLEEAAFGLENLLFPPREIEENAKEALASVGLAGFEDRAPSALSGGEKQRLVIASFLAMKTKILVLDETLSRLDPGGVKQVMSALKELKARRRITVVMSMHESAIALKFADRVCVLCEGRIAACDTAEKIFSDKKLLEDHGIELPEEYNINSFFAPAAPRSPIPDPRTALQIKNFSFSYAQSENALLKNINLTFSENEFTAIIGHNGCGKSTLFNLITGLLRPIDKKTSAGDIFIRGKNIKDMAVSDISKEIGYVMQNPDNQLFLDTVYKEVSFALKNTKPRLSKNEIDMRVTDALDLLGLRRADAFPHSLSRQDRSKVVIASVLAMGCKIILFDEIDGAEDYEGKIKIMNIAQELYKKGYAVIFTTHNMPLVCKYAQRLIVMEKDCTITEWKRKN